MTPRITTDKARNMLLEEERYRKTLDPGTVRVELIVTKGLILTIRRKRTLSEKVVLN